MKTSSVVLAIGFFVLFVNGSWAWGGIFNRFSPEILANLGYGGDGYSRPQPYYEVEAGYEGEEDMNGCYGLTCTSNAQCCPQTVCSEWAGAFGRCVFMHGRRFGEVCRRDADCDSGLICAANAGSLLSSCNVPLSSPKQYNEDCSSSTDCDQNRGLCCQLQRRHRQTHRKACAYFKNPLICIGTVSTSDHINGNDVQLSGAEKRLTD